MKPRPIRVDVNVAGTVGADKLAASAVAIQTAGGIYIRLNPVKPELLARSVNPAGEQSEALAALPDLFLSAAGKLRATGTTDAARRPKSHKTDPRRALATKTKNAKNAVKTAKFATIHGELSEYPGRDSNPRPPV